MPAPEKPSLSECFAFYVKLLAYLSAIRWCRLQLNKFSARTHQLGEATTNTDAKYIALNQTPFLTAALRRCWWALRFALELDAFMEITSRSASSWQRLMPLQASSEVHESLIKNLDEATWDASHARQRAPFTICAWWNFHHKRVKTQHVEWDAHGFFIKTFSSARAANFPWAIIIDSISVGVEDFFPLNFNVKIFENSPAFSVCAHVWFTIKASLEYMPTYICEAPRASLSRKIIFRLHLRHMKMKIFFFSFRFLRALMKTTNADDTVRNGN